MDYTVGLKIKHNSDEHFLMMKISDCHKVKVFEDNQS